jgi:tetratricopeptide (TPR) repeat protein
MRGGGELERGREHFDRGEIALAAASFERALHDGVRRHPQRRRAALVLALEARLQLGLAHFHLGRDAAALAEFDRVLHVEPGRGSVRELRARIYYRSGRLSQAIRDLERVVTDEPRPDPHLLLAVCRHQSGSPGAAVRILDRAADLVRQAGGGSFAPRHCDPSEPAIAEAERAVRSRPYYPDLRCRLARLLAATGRGAEALVQLERALQINPRYREARLLMARVWLSRGDRERAIVALEAELGEQAGYPDLHFWLGFARLLAGAPRPAATALARAVDLNPYYARANRLLGLARHMNGDYAEAMRLLRRGFVRDREIPEAFTRAGRGDPARRNGAGAELRRAVACQSDYPDLHLELAYLHGARGETTQARAACRAALALHPGYGLAALELARLELVRGDAAAAGRLLADVVRRYPRWADAQGLLGRARRLIGDLAGAEGPLRAALALNAGYVEAHRDLARLESGRLQGCWKTP